MNRLIVALFAALILVSGCNPSVDSQPSTSEGTVSDRTIEAPPPSGIDDEPDLPTPPGMVWIPGGQFVMGSNHREARPIEQPTHVVELTGFYMECHEITNAKFAEFVDATNYVTTAEKKPDMEDILAQRAPDLPPVDPAVLVAGSLVFQKTATPVSTSGPGDFVQWWHWTPGANWRHPMGPESSLEGLQDHPVVHVSWDDAVAYCRWAGKQLPTEAQWERAARGGLNQQPYVWGADEVSDQNPQANIWQGQFPNRNAALDGYERTAPVGVYPANGYGLFDMAGNVWEWCSDWHRDDTYKSRANSITKDPQGPDATDHPYEPRRAQRGGSFLCHRDYCSAYRPSGRASTSADTGLSHVGFRPVMTEAQWRERLETRDKPAVNKDASRSGKAH